MMRRPPDHGATPARVRQRGVLNGRHDSPWVRPWARKGPAAPISVTGYPVCVIYTTVLPICDNCVERRNPGGNAVTALAQVATPTRPMDEREFARSIKREVPMVRALARGCGRGSRYDSGDRMRGCAGARGMHGPGQPVPRHVGPPTAQNAPNGASTRIAPDLGVAAVREQSMRSEYRGWVASQFEFSSAFLRL